MRLAIKVVPGASRDGIAGWLDEALKIRVRAPAERGKANAAAERILAEALGIAPEQIQVVAGKTSQRKVVEISGLTDAEALRRLGGGGR